MGGNPHFRANKSLIGFWSSYEDRIFTKKKWKRKLKQPTHHKMQRALRPTVMGYSDCHAPRHHKSSINFLPDQNRRGLWPTCNGRYGSTPPKTKIFSPYPSLTTKNNPNIFFLIQKYILKHFAYPPPYTNTNMDFLLL